ncbi:MAG: TonB family protein [Pseudomonadota bacterium]
MNYAAQSRMPNAGALVGSLAIPAGIGALLVTGLAVTYALPVPKDNPIGVTVTPEPIDLPPPEVVEPETPEPTTQQQASKPVAPDTPFVFDPGPAVQTDPIDALDDTLVLLPPVDLPGDLAGPPGPAPSPLAEPTAAVPRGNPGDWITTSDYRTSWLNRGFEGTARFTLAIDARGRVSDCAITASTGHSVLDGATCRLLTRRARFNPARDGAGEKVPGTFSSSITWRIPE